VQTAPTTPAVLAAPSSAVSASAHVSPNRPVTSTGGRTESPRNAVRPASQPLRATATATPRPPSTASVGPLAPDPYGHP
jgi:hypothetical protein